MDSGAVNFPAALYYSGDLRELLSRYECGLRKYRVLEQCGNFLNRAHRRRAWNARPMCSDASGICKICSGKRTWNKRLYQQES